MYHFKMLLKICRNFIRNMIVVLGGITTPITSFISLSTKTEKIGNYEISIGKNVHISGRGKIRVADGTLYIGDGCDLRDVNISANKGKITIGENSFLNSGCIITSLCRVTVGSGCAFGTNVSIYDHDHIYRATGKQDWNISKSDEIIIGDNCWIGCNVIILRGSVIGNNCVVGAGTIIKGNIPDSTIVYNENKLLMRKL